MDVYKDCQLPLTIFSLKKENDYTIKKNNNIVYNSNATYT